MTGKMLLFFVATSFPAWFLLFAGIGTRRDTRRQEELEHTRATGVVVDYIRREIRTGKRGSMTSWRPVVEYTAEGQPYREEYKNAMNRAQFPAGTSVEVLYDASDPTRFHLEADPVFIHRGAGAIRVSLIWILASAALSIFLAVFVGGARFGFMDAPHRAPEFFHGRR